MLIVQPSQYHRRAVTNPISLKSFPTVTVTEAAELRYRHRKRGNRCGERRITCRPHDSIQASPQQRFQVVVGVLHPTCRKNQGGNLESNLEFSKRWRVWKDAGVKQQAASVMKWQQKLTFGTLNVRTTAVKYIKGIGYIGCLLRICTAKGCGVIEL